MVNNLTDMNLTYFYLDEKSLSYSNLLEKILIGDSSLSDNNSNHDARQENYYNVKFYYL